MLLKTIKCKDSIIEIHDNDCPTLLKYEKPEWSDSEEPCFEYGGETYFLSEFINVNNEIYSPNPPSWLKEFDGYLPQTYFSGILVKLSDYYEDEVKVYDYFYKSVI